MEVLHSVSVNARMGRGGEAPLWKGSGLWYGPQARGPDREVGEQWKGGWAVATAVGGAGGASPVHMHLEGDVRAEREDNGGVVDADHCVDVGGERHLRRLVVARGRVRRPRAHAHVGVRPSRRLGAPEAVPLLGVVLVLVRDAGGFARARGRDVRLRAGEQGTVRRRAPHADGAEELGLVCGGGGGGGLGGRREGGALGEPLDGVVVEVGMVDVAHLPHEAQGAEARGGGSMGFRLRWGGGLWKRGAGACL